MSNIINTNSIGTERKRIVRGIIVTIQALSQQKTVNRDSWDMFAFIALSLARITKTVDQAALAWEKRGYWVKADRFRREWMWTDTEYEKLNDAVLSKNIDTAIQSLVIIGSKLKNTKVSKNHRMGKPWIGAYDIFMKKPGK